jgi:hypothetical protein
MKRLLLLITILSFSVCLDGQTPTPGKGYVPDEKTAISIAETTLSKTYGAKQIQQERPFHGTLKEGIWTVAGSLPPNSAGGVAVIHIDQRTGKIISYSHGK